MKFDIKFYVSLFIITSAIVVAICQISPTMPIIIRKVMVMFSLCGILIDCICVTGFIHEMKLKYGR